VDKIIELTYVKCLHIIYNITKKENDEVKLWREALDNISLINIIYKPTSNQFEIISI